MAEKRTERMLQFSVQGEFLTELAREQLHHERRGNSALAILLSAMDGTDLPEYELINMAMEILDGRAELYGTYPGDNYGIRRLEEQEKQWSIFVTIERLANQIKQLEKDRQNTLMKLETAFHYVPKNRHESIMQGKSYNEIEREFRPSPLLQSFIDRMSDEEEHETGDYGWIEPDGTFHEVEYAHHEEFAEKYIRENMSHEEWIIAGTHVKGNFNSNQLFITFSDYLVEKGWVLLDSPHGGIAEPMKNPAKPYTKRQRDFLYGYYIDRKQTERANRIMQDA